MDIAAVPTASMLKRIFEWHSDTGDGHAVSVAGDFTDWQPIPLRVQKQGVWRYTHRFEPTERGVYMYKFIVDGVWQHDPLAYACLDNDGNVNNVVEVFEKAVHEHDNYKLLHTMEEGYPQSTEGWMVYCDGCQQERLEDYYHCLTCGRFDYCTACYTSRHARSRAFAKDTRPHALAAWVASTRAHAFLEAHPPMARTDDDEAMYLAFVRQLDALLKRNGNTNTSCLEHIQTSDATFLALQAFTELYPCIVVEKDD